MDPARAKRSSWLNDQRVRGLVYQTLLLGCVGALAYGAVDNVVINMRARGIPMAFGFWNDVAGFDINLHLINYSNLSTYGQAFWVGLLNTLLIAVICIPLATVLGFVVGVARLSPNWLLSRFALVYTHSRRRPLRARDPGIRLCARAAETQCLASSFSHPQRHFDRRQGHGDGHFSNGLSRHATTSLRDASWHLTGPGFENGTGNEIARLPRGGGSG